MSNQSLVVVLLLATLAGCASPPRFYESRVTASEYDGANAATRVTVSFELWDADGLPIHDIDASELRVWEDGALATSESTIELDHEKHPIEVILLLDRSASARDNADSSGVQATAERILAGLAAYPCTVTLYSFANTVESLASPAALTASGGGDGTSRWTALYHAIDTVLSERGLLRAADAPSTDDGRAPQCPSTVLVVCTDGADNYSHNHGVTSLGALESQVLESGAVIHALGLGNIAAEQDRQGVPGDVALRRLAAHGGYHEASDPAAAANVVEQVARFVRATYSCVFVSPSIQGEHELVFEVVRDGRSGRSPAIRFPAQGPPAAPEPR
jgi:hypothetical protein